MGMLRAKTTAKKPKKNELAYREVGHALVDSNKRIVKFDANIGKTGIFESWLVCHVHHVKVVLKRDFILEAGKNTTSLVQSAYIDLFR